MAQFLPAPRPRQLGAVDFIPNLLITTLAAVAPFLPLQAGRAMASAPAIKGAVQCELLVRPLTLGMNPQPNVRRLDQSAPYPKFQVQVDQLRAPLTLGMNPQPGVGRLDANAPTLKGAVQLDRFPNLLATTLAPAAGTVYTKIQEDDLTIGE